MNNYQSVTTACVKSLTVNMAVAEGKGLKDRRELLRSFRERLIDDQFSETPMEANDLLALIDLAYETIFNI